MALTLGLSLGLGIPTFYIVGFLITARIAKVFIRRYPNFWTDHEEAIGVSLLWPVGLPLLFIVWFGWWLAQYPIRIHEDARRANRELLEQMRLQQHSDYKKFLREARAKHIAKDKDQWGHERVLWELRGIYHVDPRPRVLQVTDPTSKGVYLIPVTTDHMSCEQAWLWTQRLSEGPTQAGERLHVYES